MTWVQMPNGRPCGTCGTAVELWVVLKCGGRKTAEATFCPICYPDVAKVFAIPEKVREAA